MMKKKLPNWDSLLRLPEPRERVLLLIETCMKHPLTLNPSEEYANPGHSMEKKWSFQVLKLE